LLLARFLAFRYIAETTPTDTVKLELDSLKAGKLASVGFVPSDHHRAALEETTQQLAVATTGGRELTGLFNSIWLVRDDIGDENATKHLSVYEQEGCIR
jgi:hypothetical protein